MLIERVIATDVTRIRRQCRFVGEHTAAIADKNEWYDLFIPPSSHPVDMGTAVKKTISLPADLARDTEALARAEGKTLSAVIQDALRQARIERRLQELRGMQGYWSRRARDKRILTEQDLERYLRE